ncbi:hypothetical protein [Salinibacter ruber]|uniref:hypothetical protein n=1 Tax=Salinibacter ruber TaxID=146919 RepID=UPI00216A2D4C|nr:hypothetical protein [Salinibacter ruber]MCS4054450.1 hypothetical protein [Salinibacter ruber]
MVVHDSKRITARLVIEKKIALEVHLPKLIGALLFEALVTGRLLRVFLTDQMMPMQDARAS